MDILLDNTKIERLYVQIIITGSKSESNRLLILQQFFTNLQIENVSNSHDTQVLKEILTNKKPIANVGHAGTAMRFLTAYFSSINGIDVTLTGSSRMQNRPIKILVDALRSIGADITYAKREGFPPLRIKGKNLHKNTISINGNVSSQYISALLLIAPSLKEGLTIELIGKVTSKPYLEMTLGLLEQVGVETSWKNNIIQVCPQNQVCDKIIVVESDWSSASYYYSALALKTGKIKISFLKENSLQGDKELAVLYNNFGIQTTFVENSIILEKTPNFKQKKHISLDLVNTPDIAQTIAVTCFGLDVSCDLTGLHTLKIKETDRLEALKNELQKFGAKVRITDDSLQLRSEKLIPTKQPISIETYEDHRMAMAFAPLSLKTPVFIKNAEVVNKSYPDFWTDFKFF